MKSMPGLALLAVAALVAALSAQQPGQAPVQSPGQSDPAQVPKGQMPTLGRPTTETDKVPIFDFDYFVGKWTFEWDVPEGPLGPAGKITGTTVYRKIDDGFYEADTDATGPAGPFKVKERIAYHKDNKAVARQVTDSRGFSYLQLGPLGGDLGGEYNIYFLSEPFIVKGKKIQIRNSIRMQSPLNYKGATSVSVDGGRFVNYGNPWWQKQVLGVTSK
jgi:hypothetical protein